jgi:predicted RNase H-like HicB family nuclease
MRTVRAIYRREADGAWIATSPEVAGYVAHGDTYEQARDRLIEGLPWYAERDLLIAHVVLPTESAQFATTGPQVSFGISRATPAPSYKSMPFARAE